VHSEWYFVAVQLPVLHTKRYNLVPFSITFIITVTVSVNSVEYLKQEI